MASHNPRGPPSGVVQTKRRTWDEDEYRAKAEERAKREGSEKGKDDYIPPKERAALTAREEVFDFSDRIGKVTAVSDKDRSSGGFYCELCDVLLRDSVAYTDHCNGKKHLRKAGISLYTKRSTLQEVLDVLEAGRRRKYPERYPKLPPAYQAPKINRTQDKKMDQEEERSNKMELTNDHQEDIKSQEKNETNHKTTNGEPQEAGEQDEMQEVLGFTSFGTSKKS